MSTQIEGTQDRDGQGFQNENQNDEKITRADISGINETVSGDDISELKKDERITHQQHGNKKHKLHKHDSAASHQPRTITGPGTV